MFGGATTGAGNMRIDFELYESDVEDHPPRYKEVIYHILFDFNMGKNFLHKSLMIAGGHKTTTSSSLTYSSVVYRESAKIDLTISAFNDLSFLCAISIIHTLL